ncbi:hypothetical protein B0H13DRAFT_2115696, partial [Mycena leptocephala]
MAVSARAILYILCILPCDGGQKTHLKTCLYNQTNIDFVPRALLDHGRVSGTWYLPLVSACRRRVQSTKSAGVRVIRGLALTTQCAAPSVTVLLRWLL